jgi:hypothetical protein
MAIVLGCFTGGVVLLSLAATVAGDRAEQQQNAAARPLRHVSDGLVLAHAAALVVCGVLALRPGTRYTSSLRIVFRIGIPLVVLGEVWHLSEPWAQRGLLSTSGGGGGSRVTSLFITFGALWSLGWSAFKIGLFLWAARYLGRDAELDSGC